MSNKFTLSTFISLCIIGSSGCVIQVGGAEREGNVSSIFGHLEVSEGKTVKDVSSVNGGVSLNDYVQAQNVDSVNGNIIVGEFVSVDSLHTVNGNIESGDNLHVKQDVRTVNGNVKLKFESNIAKDIETINGNILLDNVTVGGDVETLNGNVSLTNNSLIQGDIVFHQKDPDSWDWHHSVPVLNIDASSSIHGNIILEREVSLNFGNPELQSQVIRRYPNSQ